MNPKVSILIPVYNVSTFIEKCAKSLFNQTFHDIEYIFVDDGSIDQSIEKLKIVLQNYPFRKSQVKIIELPQTKGSAVARNIALLASTGDYISFVDSDDYIDEDMIELLYLKIKEDNAEMAVCNTSIEYATETVIAEEYVSDDSNTYFQDFIKFDNTTASLCNKLVIRNLYLHDECKFIEGLNYLEDRHIMSRVYYFVKKISKVDRAMYHYIQYNSNSITKTKKDAHFQNIIQYWELLDNFLKTKNTYTKYYQQLILPKVQSKARLMIETNQSNLRKKYRSIFICEEKQCLNHLRKGERLMLFLVRYRLFWATQLLHNYLVIKHKKKLIKL